MPTIFAVDSFFARRRPDSRLYEPELGAFWDDQRGLHVVGRSLAEQVLPSKLLTRKIYPTVEGQDLHASYRAPWGDDPDNRSGQPGLHKEHVDLLRAWFTTGAVRTMERDFVVILHKLIAEYRERARGNGGRFDLAALAGRFALGCASRIIGLDLHHADWREKIDTYVSSNFGEEPRQRDIDREIERLVARRRASGKPRGQLIDALIAAVDDGRLDEQYIVPIVWMVLIATESTTSANIVSKFGMLDERNQLDYVRRHLHDGPALSRVVEECLRLGHVFDSTPPLMAVRDMQIGDFDVPQDTIVTVWYMSANRDMPGGEEFDITRQPNHIAFSVARDPHVCLGASMARRMMHLALVELTHQLPCLRRDPEGEVLQYVSLNNSYLKADFLTDSAA